VLTEWKDPSLGEIVLREYTVKKNIKVRDGVVGKQIDVVNGVEVDYPGGGHQYEFTNDWRYDNFSDFLIRSENYLTLE
jgi:hypothetical protein